ncbi:MAG TPA: hypothetical protein VMV53_03990 [Acidimicrobiales bacterium]|nr:hypothetical protein [Acidimicrobiales bacterium]
MRLTRVIAVLAVVIYVGLWVLALNGASNLVPPLLIPLVLAVLVWAGLALNRYLEISPRKQEFKEREDDDDR